jgi:murein tripeptide amidase MpaA
MTVCHGSLVVLLVVTGPGLVAQALPQTTPERTGYTATSTNAEVAACLDSLEFASAPLTVSELGTTALGRPIDLAIAADPPVTSAAEAAAAGKLVVYLQANIHAGEVEGKEAVLALLREVAGARHNLLQKLVILVAPDYNPNGNAAFGPEATRARARVWRSSRRAARRP